MRSTLVDNLSTDGQTTCEPKQAFGGEGRATSIVYSLELEIDQTSKVNSINIKMYSYIRGKINQCPLVTWMTNFQQADI